MFTENYLWSYERPTASIPARVPLRPGGLLETYYNSGDTRSWVHEKDEIGKDRRRKHILSLIRANPWGICLGRYLPITTAIEILCRRREAICRKRLLRVMHQLKKCSNRNGVFIQQLDKLYELLDGIPLTPDQRKKLGQIKSMGLGIPVTCNAILTQLGTSASTVKKSTCTNVDQRESKCKDARIKLNVEKMGVGESKKTKRKDKC